MRATRLLGLLALLQTRRRATGAELAEELGVSIRTIYRDLETLSGAGFPIVTDRGPGGGCALLGEYRSRLAALSGEEADALWLAGLPGPAAELGFGALLAAAQRKLLAALPPRVRESAAAAGTRFHLDPADWFRPVPDHPALADVARAVWSERVLELRYTRGDGHRVERRLEPHGLILKAAAWYVVGRVEGQLRVYRVSRIETVRVSEDGFERDAEFDLGGFWRDWSQAFEDGLPRYPAQLRLSPDAQARLHVLGDAVRRAPREPAPEVDASGWQRRHVTFERLEYALGPLLTLGPEVEVLEPAELRDAVTAAARAILALYDPHDIERKPLVQPQIR